jgi:hypothetical protein
MKAAEGSPEMSARGAGVPGEKQKWSSGEVAEWRSGDAFRRCREARRCRLGEPTYLKAKNPHGVWGYPEAEILGFAALIPGVGLGFVKLRDENLRFGGGVGSVW